MVCQWHRNPEISVPSRNNPEMSQHSSDVPMLVNFSIYIFPSYLHWTGLYHLNSFQGKKLISHRPPLKSETFEKSQLSEPLDVPSGCYGIGSVLQWLGSGSVSTRNFLSYQSRKVYSLLVIHYTMGRDQKILWRRYLNSDYSFIMFF